MSWRLARDLVVVKVGGKVRIGCGHGAVWQSVNKVGFVFAYLDRYRRGRQALTKIQSRWKAFVMRRTYANVARQITVLQVCVRHGVK
jgi:hypothetical protein